MTVFFLKVIIIFIATIICPSDSLFCSYGERFSLCDNNDCQRTCEHPQGPRFCEHKCRPGCVCNSGLVRREKDQKCVPIEECPKKKPQKPGRQQKEPSSLFCPYRERFSLCGNHECQPTCEHPQGPKFCEPKCNPGCVCNSGLVRRETDKKCVPIEECPRKKPQKPGRLTRLGLCPEGQVFSLCGNHQCQHTCRHPAGPKGCKSTCRPGCVCDSGLVRRESDHECVPLEKCPRIVPEKPVKRPRPKPKTIYKIIKTSPGHTRVKINEVPRKIKGGGSPIVRCIPRKSLRKCQGGLPIVRCAPRKSVKKCQGLPRHCRKRKVFSFLDIGPCKPKFIPLPYGK